MIKIVFISHDASRTGAPILLLRLASLLKRSGKYEVTFLINRAPLDILAEFNRYGTILAFTGKVSEFVQKRIPGRIKRYFNLTGYSQSSVSKAVKGADLVVSNTITNGDILPFIRKYYDGPIISYVHELSIASQYFTSADKLSRVLALSDHFFVPSQAVKDFLTGLLKIANDRVSLQPYFLTESEPPKDRNRKDVFTIGGVGTIDWRKGPEIFVQTAIHLFKLAPGADVHFIWKGASEGIDLKRLQNDVMKAGLEARVVFELSSDSTAEFYNRIDILLLTSREDPYPLVVLEAAASGVPTVCFENAGGAPEFVMKSKGGLCVPFLDTAGMAEAALQLYRDRDTCDLYGSNARAHLITTHASCDFVLNAFNRNVSDVIASFQLVKDGSAVQPPLKDKTPIF